MNVIKNVNYYLLSSKFPDIAVKLSYYRIFRKKINLRKPKTFNEKINWMKLNLYCDSKIITQCADKYSVREYVKKIEPDILNNLINSYKSVDEINWGELPDKFVVKLNHGAGYNIVCRDKTNFDIDEATKKLKKWWSEDFWKRYTETQYRNICKRVIIEEFIETDDKQLPSDYKIYCFEGKAFCTMVCEERETGKTKFYFCDLDGNILPYSKESLDLIDKRQALNLPENYKKMIQVAENLSSPFPFVRVDLYSEKGKIIFGELTFTPSAGLDRDILFEGEETLGKLITII